MNHENISKKRAKFNQPHSVNIVEKLTTFK